MNLNTMTAVEIVEAILIHAQRLRVSDVHIDPRESQVVIRTRVDGVLGVWAHYPTNIHDEVIVRIKVLSGLRIDEHHIPQDGRFSVSRLSDVRVVVTPSYFGEAVVMRLLKPYDMSVTLSSLGFALDDISNIRNVLQRHSGMVMIAGPTGSGKTTTLYTLLQEIISEQKTIVTIEDPIEYIISHARQIAVRIERLSFAQVLRSVLRQDPNIIMVGEIRDAETAQVACTAALTGHLVLSTIHTRSADATVSRLRNMNIEQYIIDATVSLVIAQRLIPLLCTDCVESYIPTESERNFIGTHTQRTVTTIRRSQGCEKCLFSGYRGRTAVYEIRIGSEPAVKTLLTHAVEQLLDGHISLQHVMTLV